MGAARMRGAPDQRQHRDTSVQPRNMAARHAAVTISTALAGADVASWVAPNPLTFVGPIRATPTIPNARERSRSGPLVAINQPNERLIIMG